MLRIAKAVELRKLGIGMQIKTLSEFPREDLRSIARKYKIKRGRNKIDTIINIVNAKNPGIEVSLEIYY